MTTGHVLGLDIGTSSCKAVVLDPDGAERAAAARPTPWRLLGGRRSLDAADLLATALETCAAARHDLPGSVVGIGVTSMAEAGFLHDAQGRAVSPALGWDDDRAAVVVPDLRADLPDFTAITGLPVSGKPTLVKHRWRRRDPSSVAATGWSNVAEYVVHLLGGDRVAEPSLASRTGWLDVDRLAWWPDAMAWSGVADGFLPPLRPAGTPVGRVTRVPGFEGAVLTVAGHDHLCAAVGVGAVTDDDVVNSCGSAEVVLRAVPPRVATEVRAPAAALGFTSGRHVVAGRMALIGGFPSGARLDRLARLLGFADAGDADLHAWDDAGSQPAMPAAEVDALLDGLGDGGAPPDAASAVRLWAGATASLAATTAERLASLLELTGPAQRVVTTGGSSRDSLVARARDELITGMQRPPVAQAAARGAAVIAAVAAGVDLAEAAALPAIGPIGPAGAA